MNDFMPLSNDVLTPNNINGGAEPAFAVATEDVFIKLAKLNPYKANGPDGIPSWLLKENADILADPVRKILNCSYSECHFPQTWKEADIVPLPKQNPVRDINKHLRPVSLTSIASRIAEDFVVQDFIKPAVLKRIDKNQFGSIPKSSTTHALISMLHNWNSQTDRSGSTVRVVLFDFKKAFDLIDHAVQIRKLLTFDIPHRIIEWIVSFLQNRKQCVKLSQDCYSEWGTVPAGVPQGQSWDLGFLL